MLVMRYVPLGRSILNAASSLPKIASLVSGEWNPQVVRDTLHAARFSSLWSSTDPSDSTQYPIRIFHPDTLFSEQLCSDSLRFQH